MSLKSLAVRAAVAAVCWCATGLDPLAAQEPGELVLPPLPVLALPAVALEDLPATKRCDRLAANPDRADADGFQFLHFDQASLKSEAAIAACRAAMAAEPNEARFHEQLSRAMLAQGDPTNARLSFAEAAARGDALAAVALADLLKTGRGGPHDIDGAYKLLERAAAGGHPAALYGKAMAVRYGLGTKHDPQRWIELLHGAAAAGSVPALRQLAIAYADGIVVAKNADIADDLFLSVVERERPRADQGVAAAMWVMGWAYQRGAGVTRDYEQALAWFRKGADINDADAIFSIGWLYDNGFGVPADKTKACDYFERAAMDGHGWMLNAVGWCYGSGEGRPRDAARAASIYQRAMAAGDPLAPRNLARLHDEGRGVPLDKVRASQLLRVAADRGQPQAMLEYGFLIRQGQPSRVVEACDWYQRAALLGLPRAMNNLAACYSGDDSGRRKDLAVALDWYEKAAALDDGLALRNLGELYLTGTNVEKSTTRALGYFKRGAAVGDPGAMVEYGMMFTRGAGTTADASTGCDWFEKAAKAGDSRGMNNLGACYANGDGRVTDIAAGIGWYERAIETGDVLAMSNLGDLLMTGRGTARDTKRALALFKRAADFGHPVGAVEYAAALFHGNGVNKDVVEACNWYERAARQDHPTGLNGLGVCFENGFGRRRDLKASQALFVKAADAGSLTALRNIVRYADRGIAGQRNPDAAADWMRKAFERGHDGLLNDIMSYPSSWTRETRRALQKGLKRDGLFDGPIDGYLTSALDNTLWTKFDGDPANRKPRLIQEFVWAPIEGAPKGLLVRVCKSGQSGSERRPLVVINHGLTTDEPERRDMRPLSCGGIANFFVQRGYTVAIPLRRGYGETGGRFSEGGTRVCATSPDFIAPGLAIAADIQATVVHMTSRSDIAAGNTIVLGHSGGGWGALALASRNAPGISGFVNISGVHGSNRNRPDGVCGPDPITKSTRVFGRTARAPTLWIYAENDSHAGPRLVKRMFEGFQQAGGRGTLHFLPAYDGDGHNIFDDDSFDQWGSLLDDWLKALPKSP